MFFIQSRKKKIAGMYFLALRMNRLFYLLSVILCFLSISCTSEEKGSVLQSPPFTSLTDSIQAQPSNPDLYYRRGVMLFQYNQPAYAQSDLQRAWALKPREEYGLSLATLLNKKNPDTALYFLQGAIKQLPNSIALKISLARGLQQKKQWKEAIAICNDIVARYPNQLDAWIIRSEILFAQQKDAEAIESLEKAYAYAPFDVELAYSLAFQYAQSKNKKALAISDSLISMDTSQRHAEPFYFKALYYESTGKPAEALKLLSEAIRHDYNFIDAHMEKGQIFYSQKKYTDAFKAFALAATISPAFADAYYWMGKCEEATGQKEAAKANYQRAYGLDKSMTEAREAAGRL